MALPIEWQQKISWICKLSNVEHLSNNIIRYMSCMPIQFFELERKTRQVIDLFLRNKVDLNTLPQIPVSSISIQPSVSVERTQVIQRPIPLPVPVPAHEIINIEKLDEQELKKQVEKLVTTEKIFPNARKKRKSKIGIDIKKPFTITPITKPDAEVKT